MGESVNRYRVGVFTILDKSIFGQLVYNKQNGAILLDLTEELGSECPFGKTIDSLPVITGKLNNGAVVTLFNNKCVRNHIRLPGGQQLVFKSQYMILSNVEAANSSYNRMECTLKNAYKWSGFSSIDIKEACIVPKLESREYDWFGAKIIFKDSISCNDWSLDSPEEELKLVKRLVLEIETEERCDAEGFIVIRDKVLSLISFAIRDNINIEKQRLYDCGDLRFATEEYRGYGRVHALYTSDPTLDILGNPIWEYNFNLDDLSNDINSCLEKLEPVFNLYLSLLKYRNMPLEVIFLNIVQALETFHSRFYCDNLDKFKKHVEERFGNCEYIKGLLLDNIHGRNIPLVSRLNYLLIGENDGLFDEVINSKDYAQIIVDTRHYYTHYKKSKEEKALKGDDLLKAIEVLRILLEYHVCLSLGISNSNKRSCIVQRLASIVSRTSK